MEEGPDKGANCPERIKAIIFWGDFLIQDNVISLEETQKALQFIIEALEKE